MAFVATMHVDGQCDAIEALMNEHLSDASSSHGDDRRLSSASTAASQCDTDDAPVAGNDQDAFGVEDGDDDSGLPKSLSTSARRRQRRQKHRAAIKAQCAIAQAHLEESCPPAPGLVLGAAAAHQCVVTLKDIGFRLCPGNASAQSATYDIAPDNGASVVALNHSLQAHSAPFRLPTMTAGPPPAAYNWTFQSARPVALSGAQGASSSAVTVPFSLLSTCPLSSQQPCEASARTANRQPASLPFIDDSNFSTHAVSVATVPAPTTKSSVDQGSVATGTLHAMPEDAAAPSPAPLTAVEFLTSPCHAGLGVTPNGILASIMSPDADAMLSWLGGGGLPTSPCSGDVAEQLWAAAPEMYED